MDDRYGAADPIHEEFPTASPRPEKVIETTEQVIAPELGLKHKSEEELFAGLMEAADWTGEDQRLLAGAYELAKNLHKDDVYKEKPYIFHLLRVANRVSGYLQVQDAEVIAAALLHDSVEDHAPDMLLDGVVVGQNGHQSQKNALDFIAQNFTPRTAELISYVTNPPAEEKEGMSYEEKLDKYVEKVKAATITAEGWLIKFSDWCDNGLGIAYAEKSLSADRIAHFQNKYGGEVLETFEERYRQPDLQQMLSPEAKAYVEHQLELGHQRLESMRDYVETLASELHERWRETRRTEDGGYEPRVKATKDPNWTAEYGTDQVDIANTTFEQLPIDWQTENREAARVAIRMRKVVGRAIHNAWLDRNEWAKGTELDKPFDLLPPEEKAKDLEQAELAMRLYKPSKS